MNGALLDTSFLITLTSARRAHHQAAVMYYRTIIGAGIPMYLSTIVVSEFEVRQRVTDLSLNNFIVVPFNIDHAVASASLAEQGQAQRADDQSRSSVKDDVKLIAQCELGGVSHFLTDDDPCCRWVERMRVAHPLRALPFAICLRDGYNGDWFNPGNQTGLRL